jgi:hypothetical protein
MAGTTVIREYDELCGQIWAPGNLAYWIRGIQGVQRLG